MNPAYVAGLIDGEGCVHLDTPRRTYRARVSVGMTQPALELLRDLQATYGGTIYQQREATERWAAAWTWHVTGDKATALLTAIRPHLRLKGQQADAVMEVEAVRAALASRPNGQRVWTEEARVECETIKARVHRLNAKGPRTGALTAVGA